MSTIAKLIRPLGVGVAAMVLAAGCATAKKPPMAAAEPAAAAAPAAPEPMMEKPADDIHVVVKGEHLWGISSYAQIYNDPYQWPLIFKRNRDQIQDADLIHPGQELKIQRDLTDQQIQQAIQHARTRGAWSLGPTEQSDLDYLAKAM